jgi:hypothetical protein
MVCLSVMEEPHRGGLGPLGDVKPREINSSNLFIAVKQGKSIESVGRARGDEFTQNI